MRKYRNSALIVVLVGLVVCLAVGCQTIEGAGQDISTLGEGMSDVARDANPGN